LDSIEVEVIRMLSDYPATATLPASDLARARNFYENTLGFKVDEETPAGIMYKSGETKVLVYPSEFAGTGEQTVVSWQVDDLRKVVDDLRGRGVRFEQYDMPDLKTDEKGVAELGPFLGAWFKDTEGNILNIGQDTR
jgi:catechol 2,3-dioxygenase-like lactoylglutathione lyase family enzyme